VQDLQQHIESLIFSSEQSITTEEILGCLNTVSKENISESRVHKIIEESIAKYESPEFGFELVELADGFQFLTKKKYYSTIKLLLQQRAKRRLSNAALETLSIIAYKQPVSKAEVEHIRGVNCDYSIQKLLDKTLISIAGKSDAPGKPLLYRYFGQPWGEYALQFGPDSCKREGKPIAEYIRFSYV